MFRYDGKKKYAHTYMENVNAMSGYGRPSVDFGKTDSVRHAPRIQRPGTIRTRLREIYPHRSSVRRVFLLLLSYAFDSTFPIANGHCSSPIRNCLRTRFKILQVAERTAVTFYMERLNLSVKNDQKFLIANEMGPKCCVSKEIHLRRRTESHDVNPCPCARKIFR